MPSQAVFGIVKNRAQVEQAIEALIEGGANPDDISILTAQGDEFHEFKKVHAKKFPRDWRKEKRIPEEVSKHLDENFTKAPEGATAGLAAGGVIGGALGLLAGVGVLAIPGIGPFIAAGPLMTALSGAGAGGTLGGIIGALIGSKIPEDKAKRLDNYLEEGGILLSVEARDDALAKQWSEILKKKGIEGVNF